ncbi:MAG: hypothetical protein ACRC8S_08850 [Fimbriiglobus sp.]
MDAELVRVAAYLRAKGLDWDQIAINLDLDPSYMEIVPAMHTKLWKEAFEEFGPVMMRESVSVAKAALLEQTRHPNQAIRQKAAQALLEYDNQLKKLDAQLEADIEKTAKRRKAKRKPRSKKPPETDTPPQ